MIIFTIICLVIITILLIVCYAIMAIAEDADARAEEMYRRWRKDRRRL